MRRYQHYIKRNKLQLIYKYRAKWMDELDKFCKCIAIKYIAQVFMGHDGMMAVGGFFSRVQQLQQNMFRCSRRKTPTFILFYFFLFGVTCSRHSYMSFEYVSSVYSSRLFFCVFLSSYGIHYY